MRKREFVRLWNDYTEATAACDVDRMLSFFTDDAVFVEPRQPPLQGKAAIRAYFQRVASRSVEFTPTWHRFIVDGEEAAIEFTFSFYQRETGRRFETRGVIVCALRGARISFLREYFNAAELRTPVLAAATGGLACQGEPEHAHGGKVEAM